MSFGWNTPTQRPGPIYTRDLSRTFQAVGNLLRLTVGRGLALQWVHGAPVLSLEGDFRLYDVITTSSWTARDSVAANRMGKGNFKFVADDLAGNLTDAGLEEFEGWNYTTGTVASGIRGIVAKVGGTWRLISAECPA